MNTLTLKEAAAFLKLHEHTVEKLARVGRLPAAKPGKRWVFVDIDLLDWLRAQYRQNHSKEVKQWRYTDEVASGTVNGKSAANELEKRLAHPTAKLRKNSMTAGVLTSGVKQSSATVV